jgi:hypothetical protein
VTARWRILRWAHAVGHVYVAKVTEGVVIKFRDGKGDHLGRRGRKVVVG